jgi:hypothetical protein
MTHKALVSLGVVAAITAGIYLAVDQSGLVSPHSQQVGVISSPYASVNASIIEEMRAEIASLRSTVEELQTDHEAATLNPSFQADSDDNAGHLLATLRHDVADLQRQLSESILVSMSTEEYPENSGMDLADPERIQSQMAEAQAQAQAVMASLERSFSEEAFDDGWASRVTDIIHEATAGEEMPGISITDTECRATLCRVVVNAADSEAMLEFQLSFGANISHELPRMSTQEIEEADGSITHVMYLKSEAYKRPGA